MLSIPVCGWVRVSLVESLEYLNEIGISVEEYRTKNNLMADNNNSNDEEDVDKLCLWHQRASYLTDVHFDLLEAMIAWYKTKNPQCVSFDAEGWTYLVLFDWCRTYAIDCLESEEDKLFTINKGAKEMSLEIYNDINDNREAWYKWSAFGGEEELAEHKEKLDRLLSELREILVKEGLIDEK